jgi:histidinol phosphatase-like enzyme (inositol monophosphatase family)
MTELAKNHLQALDAFILQLHAAAGEVILPLFRADHGLENKASQGAFDPVTEADKGAEAAIRALIAKHYPDHGVIGEEYGEDRPDAEFVWVLDPIDGTRAFVAGLPVWTTLIGLRHRGRPVLGLIGQSFLGESFVGSQALGSRLIKGDMVTPLRVRDCGGLSQAIIATTDTGLFDLGEAAAWADLRKQTRLARMGCDAYAYAMVALGTMDLVLETGLKAWDIDAAIPVIEGAGGLVTDWLGQTIGPRPQDSAGQMLISATKACQDSALALLAKGAKGGAKG